jgi:lysophospholipase L1-like esterase
MSFQHYKKIIGNVRKEQCVVHGTWFNVAINTDATRKTIEAQRRLTMCGNAGQIKGLRPYFNNFYFSSVSAIDSSVAATNIAFSFLNESSSFVRKGSIGGEIFKKVGRGAFVAADNGIDIDFAPNEQFRFKTGFEVASNGLGIVGGASGSSSADGLRYHTDSLAPANDASDCGGRVHNTNTILNYTATNATSSGQAPGPAIISGLPEKYAPSILFIGDNQARGIGDGVNGDGNGGVGFIMRGTRIAASGTIACAGLASTALRLAIFSNDGAIGSVFDKADLFSHVLFQIGGNSVVDSLGATQLSLRQLAIRGWQMAKLRGCRTIQAEILPRTVDATNAATIAGFEVGGRRDQFNAWCKSVAGRKIDTDGNFSDNGAIWLDNYWELNDLVQDPINNRWLSASYTSDGNSLSATGHALLATRIAQLSDALTVEGQ